MIDLVRVVKLEAADEVDPIGLDERPRLSWQLHAERDVVGVRHESFRIVVWVERSGKQVVFDTGFIESSKQGHPYAGTRLESRTVYHWSVTVGWSATIRGDRVTGSSESAVATFETGLLHVADWGAQWIGLKESHEHTQTKSLSAQHLDVVRPGETLGQIIESRGPITGMSLHLGSTDAAGASCWIQLRTGGSDGPIVRRMQITRLPGSYFSHWLEIGEPLPAGIYCIEVKDAIGMVGWWTDRNDQARDMPALSNGRIVGGRRTYLLETPPSAAAIVKRVFQVQEKPVRARLFICGLGYQTTTINSERVSEARLEPAPTNYDKRVLYSTVDVTERIAVGANDLRIALGRGYYATRNTSAWAWNAAPWNDDPKVLCRLELEFSDGNTTTIVSDPEWSAVRGPVVRDELYGGETWDLRVAESLESDPSAWHERAHILPAPRGRLRSHRIPSTIVHKRISPVSTQVVGRTITFDFGTVLTGSAFVTAEGASGTELELRYSEKNEPPDEVRTDNAFVPGATQVDRAILSGAHDVWRPEFTYKGFQYISVNAEPMPRELEVLAELAYTNVPTASRFEADNTLLQWIDDATGRTLLNNFQGIPTDTPTYEKNGWTGDAHLLSGTAMHHFDMRRFYTKWLRDLADAQADSGLVPLIAPTSGWGMRTEPTWAAAYPIIVWEMYLFYGDESVLVEHYERLRRYALHLAATMEPMGWHWRAGGYGDWKPPGFPTPPEGADLLATAFAYRAVELIHLISELVSPSDAPQLEEIARHIADSFVVHYFNGEDAVHSTLGGYRQTSNAVAIAFGLVPEQNRSAAVGRLVSDITTRTNGHLDTGVVGSKYLLQALTQNGHRQLALDIVLQETFPSWGHWMRLGASTLYETWESTARSRNHYFFGSVSQWIREHVAGVRPAAPGFLLAVVSPVFDSRVPALSYAVQTPHGEISVSWSRLGDDPRLELVVPPGTRVRLELEAVDAEAAAGYFEASAADGADSITLESGSYRLPIAPVD